ncbi:flagellar hook-length control protein FliK [Megalodesulfovibrio paquesii]
MQILPLSQQLQQQVDAYTSSFSSDSGDGQNFSNILSSLSRDTTSSTTSSTTASATGSSSTQGTTTLGSEKASAATLKVSAEDFSALEQDLRSAGLSKEEVETLREKVTSENGMTWQSLMQEVNQTLDAKNTGESSRKSLTDEELRTLHGFFQKLGFTPTESKELLTQFSSNQGSKAWVQIQAKIAEMGDSKTVSMRYGELAALAKLTGLDESAAQQFAGIFNANGEARLGRAGLQAITMTLRQTAAITNGELTGSLRDSTRDLLNDKLKSALNQALDEAKRDQLASNKESRDVQAQRFNIKEAAARNHRQTDEGAVEGTKGETPDPLTAKAAIAEVGKRGAEDAAKNGQTDHTGTTSKDATQQTAQQARDALLKGHTSAEAQQGQAQEKNTTTQDQPFSKQEQSWRDMWNKIGADAHARTSTTATTSTTTTSTAQAEAVAAAARAQDSQLLTQQAKMSRAEAAFQRAGVSSERVLQTVQEGMLRSLNEGVKQLTLRLDPPDLGKVTVVLQMNANKEVTATLRTDNQDTAHLLSQQMTQLRQHLEQQGLKVEKLDVQTNLAQDQQAAWQGAGQHNYAQEQGARAAEQRAWGFLRRAAAQDAQLAQEMQNDGAGEESSRLAMLRNAGVAAGINIIA